MAMESVFDSMAKFKLSIHLTTATGTVSCHDQYLAIILIQEIAGSSEFAIYHVCVAQWRITPCLTGSNNAHGATSKFLQPKPFYRSIQQQFQLLRAIFVITFKFGRGTHTGTVISVLHFRLA